jgi:hypothetical protein
MNLKPVANGNKLEIDVTALPAGIYYINSQTNSERLSRTFVKE